MSGFRVSWGGIRSDRRPPLATCFGGGGGFGVGFNLGVARALIEAGIPITSGPMIGTSAGAWSAAALAVGVEMPDILTSWGAGPHLGKATVIDIARPVFGQARNEHVSSMAIRVPVGHRTMLSGADHDLADLVAASSSPPQVSVPHRIDGRQYIDAGILTTTSADRMPAADLLVVVAPLAGPVLGWVGAMSARVLALELTRWRATGGRVLLIRPNRAIGALAGTRTSDVLDAARAEPTYRAAYELGSRCVERFRAHHPQLATSITG